MPSSIGAVTNMFRGKYDGLLIEAKRDHEKANDLRQSVDSLVAHTNLLIRLAGEFSGLGKNHLASPIDSLRLDCFRS